MPRISLWAILSLWVGIAAAPFARAQTSGSTQPALIGSIADESLNPGNSQTVDLTQVFGLPGVTGTVVQFNSVLGTFNVELYDQVTPLTVANFLGYVKSGAYNGVIINRSVPGFVEQGGGYTVSGSSLAVVSSNGTVNNEFHVSNTRGTIAMAKTAAGPNTATNQWFFNLADNSANLDNQNGGFTVFGQVLGTGMSVVDQMASEPVADLSASLNADFSALPLVNYTSGSVSIGNLIQIPTVAVVPILPTRSSTASVLTFQVTSSNPAVATATLSASSLSVTALQAGTTTVTVTVTDSNGNSVQASFAVTVKALTFAPTIQQGPASQTVAAGSTVVFSVSAAGSPAPSYQWQLNGQTLTNATSARLVIANASSANAGNYSCVVSNALGTVASGSASLALSATTDVGRLLNLSVLSTAGNGQTLRVGFVSGGGSGAAQEALLVRASGPALLNFGLSNVLADPNLTVINGSGTTVAENDNWSFTSANQSAVTAAGAATGAFALTVGSPDAAVALPLASGPYSVAVTGPGNLAGATLAEVYDNTPSASFSAASPRLINLSCLNSISGTDTLTAGFVVAGSTSKTVLVRATGPALATLGVSNVMPDPQIKLFSAGSSGSTQIAANAGWGGDQQINTVGAAVQAFSLPDATSKDSVVLVTLPPGQYSAQASSVSDASGQVLVEVYAVP